MKTQELLDQIKDLCLYTGTGRDNNILRNLYQTMVGIYNMPYHWRGLEAFQDLVTVAHQPYVTVPSNVGLIYTIRQVTTSPWAKLRSVQAHKFHEYIPQPTMYAENKPLYYTWFGGRLWLYPIPDAVYTLTMYYYKKPSPLKLYNTGTAALATLALTGTSTYWLDNLNVVPGMFFTFTADKQSDSFYPWATIDTVTANAAATISAAYTGATANGVYSASTDSIFPIDFDPYLSYSTAMLEIARNREIGQLASFLTGQISSQMAGLVENQTSQPDEYYQVMDFAREPVLLGDDYARFPFIQSAP